MSSLAPHVPTSEDIVRKMLELAELKSGEHLYDLGSGDGRIIIMAAKDFGATAVGVELREDLVKYTRNKIVELGLDGRVRVIHGDLLKADIKDANVVTLYLTTSANEKVATKLESELRPRTRVVSYCFRMPSWEPTKIMHLETRTIYLYTLPPTKKE
jgi:ubiquinone/menaquinone biosynthesis C-methylase UbiE